MPGMSFSSGLTISRGLALNNGLSTGAGLTADGIGGGGYTPPTAAFLLGDELSGLALDFLINSYAGRTVTSAELIAIQLGDEWNGLAIDFTTNLYLNRVTSSQAEQLLGPGPAAQEPYALALSFTDNTSAMRR